MIELHVQILKVAVVVVVAGLVTWMVVKSLEPGTPPTLDPNECWGPKLLKTKQDTSIRPFSVKFGEEMIQDLLSRLNNHREIRAPLDGAAFRYGFNSEQLNVWRKYWADEYKFSEREKFLNQFPQYKTNIQGLDIHFIRVKPEVRSGVTIVPILLMHGWPGSVREFYEAIPLLTKQAPEYNFAFEVIVPSLPGYGFSDAAVRPGLGPAQVAIIFKNLMNRLGFHKYYIQGGDWGSVIATMMATMFPEDVLGYHSNFLFVYMNACSLFKIIIGAFVPSLIVEPHLAERMYPLSKLFAFLIEESGYFHLQATKPDTVGTALSDSPIGLLAYTLEKFSTAADFTNRDRPDGGLYESYTKEQLLDNLMVYWSTNSITTSIRLYYEAMRNDQISWNIEKYQSKVPTWALQAKYEMYQPPYLLKSKHTNLLGVTVLDEGGHYFAFEKPQIFVDDVFKAVREFRKFHAAKTEL